MSEKLKSGDFNVKIEYDKIVIVGKDRYVPVEFKYKGHIEINRAGIVSDILMEGESDVQEAIDNEA